MTKIAQQRTKDVDFIIFWTVEKLSRFPDEIFKFFSENTTLLQKFCAGKTMQKSTYCMLHHFAPQTFLFSFFFMLQINSIAELIFRSQTPTMWRKIRHKHQQAIYQCGENEEKKPQWNTREWEHGEHSDGEILKYEIYLLTNILRYTLFFIYYILRFISNDRIFQCNGDREWEKKLK